MQNVAKLAVVVVVVSGLTAWWIKRMQPGLVVDEQRVVSVLRAAFPQAPAGWAGRLEPDATLAACTEHDNRPPPAILGDITARERARIQYPADGSMIGDWRRGEAIAQSGYGMRFTDEPATAPVGGNCYACHRITPGEVSYGTIGVSLVGYGRQRRFGAQDARAVYEKIYDSHATQPCSLMPRYGANGVLTPAQIVDLVALLMDPESPVNAP